MRQVLQTDILKLVKSSCEATTDFYWKEISTYCFEQNSKSTLWTESLCPRLCLKDYWMEQSAAHSGLHDHLLSCSYERKKMAKTGSYVCVGNETRCIVLGVHTHSQCGTGRATRLTGDLSSCTGIWSAPTQLWLCTVFEFSPHTVKIMPIVLHQTATKHIFKFLFSSRIKSCLHWLIFAS